MRTPIPLHRRGLMATAVAAVSGLVLAGLASTGAQADSTLATASNLSLDDTLTPFLGGDGSTDVDTRAGKVLPTAAQKSAVQALGASVRWTRFGTPESLIKEGGYLGTGLSGDAVTAARSWLRSNAALFKLTTAQVNGLELVNDQLMSQSNGHAVLFRQKFGGLTSAVDGMVTVGVVQGKVAYVSSSIAPQTATPAAGQLTAKQAWIKAATDAGRIVVPAAVTTVDSSSGWTVLSVKGFSQQQQVRQRALPAPDGSVRRVYEANVVDVGGATTLAVTSYVDATTGEILVRHNQVDYATENDSFQGTITATDCGPRHSFMVDDDTKTVIVAASAAVVTNDIVLNLYYQNNLVASSDTSTSPEAVTYSPGGDAPAGEYQAEVCPFSDPTAPFTAPGNYVGTFTASDQATPTVGVPYPPVWKYFLANPKLNYSTTNTTDSRKLGCWIRVAMTPKCSNPPSPLNNLAARGPWDYNFRTNTPTFTTLGNAADTAEAWASPDTPGGADQRPVSTNRHYGYDNALQGYTDAWNNTQCSPLAFTPVNNNNDIQAAVTNLFSSHNRLHDWAYFLGFTERNYNLQDSNFGNPASGGTVPTGGEGDVEVGNVQAGALSGGQPSFLGRDNANQITLQDGTPGITNQYLFQPIAGAFYAPCTDGDYDMTVVGHEYNHAISNRMVGGPDENLTGFQAGSMGESWGDQVALEYLFEHSYSTGAGTAVEGPYVTGNKVTGIRNYALNNNPLQYGDLGYDVTGPEVHADGEPWSAVMWDVRQALINKYNADFPVTNAALQRRCAQGDMNDNAPQAPLAAQFCPGNRRWIQMLFDAYLLQQPATSMLDARDAMLAADVMRFGGANQAVMWNAFAKRGFGENAATASTEDDQPTPDYTSPYANEGTLTIAANEYTSAGKADPVTGTLYVGRYQARVTPVADTDAGTPLPDTMSLVPGTYDFVFQADGYGLTRFTATVRAGKAATKQIHLSLNLASSSNGGTVDGASVGSVNTTKLIDDSEASNWAGVNPTGVSVDTPGQNPFVNIDLAGDNPVPVRSVKVSALLRPAADGQDEDPDQPDDDSGTRFTALRDFAIATCTQSVTSDCSSLLPADVPGSPYTTIYDSTEEKADGQAAFDSTLPRPLAPDLLFKTFDVPDTEATHVRLIALENQCSGTPEYAGEQDADPINDTDCKAASTGDESVRAAELEVFSFDSSVRPPGDPVVAMSMAAPATAAAGSTTTSTMTYTNLGPKPSSGATITDVLPASLSFVSASNGGTYDAATRTVTWDLGTVAVNYTGTVTLRTKIPASTPAATVILNQAQFSGALTYSLPAASVTTVS